MNAEASGGQSPPALARHNSARRRRWLPEVCKLLIVALIIWFIRGTLKETWDELSRHRLRLDFGWLALSGGLYLAGTFPAAVFWHRTLKALGQNIGFGRTLRAYYLGHLGKYVPGKAMVVIVRAGLIRSPGVEAPLAVVSIFYETLTMMSAGALLAAGVAAAGFCGQPWLFLLALGLMALAGLPTLPPVLRRLARLFGLGRLSPPIMDKLGSLDFRLMLVGWVLNAVGWAILGLSFWAALRAVGADADNPFAQLHLYTAAVALATVAGFVSMVPGGAVVREAVLAELMRVNVGGGVALVAALALRGAWLVAELIISGVLYVAFRRHSRL
jgi:uncharacterized membrane protein YbhN (UPF0104 family)